MQNFFDPILTFDGKPFGQERYREIVQELYVISKQINTSYQDLKQVTPLERDLLIKHVVEDLKKQSEAIQRQRMK